MNDIAFKFVETLGNELSAGDLKLPAFPDIAMRIKKALESLRFQGRDARVMR